MVEFRAAQAFDKEPEVLAAECAARLGDVGAHKLGFVYATASIAGSFDTMVTDLRRRTGVETWIGTVGLGVCAAGAEYFDQPALVVMTCNLDRDAFHVLSSIPDPERAVAARTKLFASVAIVHGDPRNARITDIVEEIAHQSGAYLVGGLTSAEGVYPQAAGSLIADGGISGVLLGGGGVEMSVGLTQGCSPIGPPRTIGECQQNILVTLDGRPAYEVLLEDIGAPADADPRQWLANIHVALIVPGSDRADYVVRNLTGIGPEQGLVAIGETVTAGDRVMFVRRDPLSAARDLERMLGDLKARAKRPPKAGLYYSCLARGPNLFRDEAHEMKALQRAFGDIPVVGFFGNGEIAHDRLYGYTGVLTLFS